MTTINIALDDGVKMPTRAHDTDAGLDLYSRESIQIPARSSYTFDTGVHIELPPNTAGFVKSKSGLNVNNNLTADGVIDVGYTGSIRVKLYNHGNTHQSIKAGQKIAQLVILPILTPAPILCTVNDFAESERGDRGFGSTGA